MLILITYYNYYKNTITSIFKINTEHMHSAIAFSIKYRYDYAFEFGEKKKTISWKDNYASLREPSWHL